MTAWSEPDFENANWEPLRRHLGVTCQPSDEHQGCPMNLWMWMYRQNGYEYYKHVDTREYLALDPTDV